MPSTTLASRATIGLIWALALWHSWLCRGLFVDGAAFLMNITRHEQFFDFYTPRLYAMVAAQVPIMTAVTLGVTDLHLLARLLSLGLFVLPTLFYTLALVRARNEPVLLAVVITAIALVFMTTSFFIVGEYNTAYGLIMAVAVWLATAERLTVRDGLFLAAVGGLAIRTYEVFIYIGPLLAAMTLWQVWRFRPRPVLPSLLHLAAAAGFLGGMVVAIDSVLHPYSEAHLNETYDTALNFWQNPQFLMAVVPVLVIAVWALVRPEQLGVSKPYRWANIFVLVLALSPLLALTDTVVRPQAKSQYVARTVSGVIVATMVVFIWCYTAQRLRGWRLRQILQGEQVRRRLLGFACLLLLATLPSDIQLTLIWESYLNTFRQVVVTHKGVVAIDDTPLSRRPTVFMVENWTLPAQSLMLRSKPGDGVVAPPRSYSGWLPFPPDDPPNFGRFFWRD
ncbi:hypothetical protein SAMN02745126_06114 [Enhydrobacter aerosaccus]|uniref:Dolichyl-phosphate-mannose-protein mannosyltransferase n=1 Tax=Enhydrobacter aerosaccus TaxID=225324 RepID=A0A1T4TEH0_9HYPH|nr:hypothetical protein [Enhydrobacter aerosaccus]SKA38823.1 hypothetical protein SAMN02745126_06114 [Enhydrobacter aerosaccus]